MFARMPGVFEPCTRLDHLEQCEPIKDMLGERFIRAFVAVKRKEYETYFGVISRWEREFLLLNV